MSTTKKYLDLELTQYFGTQILTAVDTYFIRKGQAEMNVLEGILVPNTSIGAEPGTFAELPIDANKKITLGKFADPNYTITVDDLPADISDLAGDKADVEDTVAGITAGDNPGEIKITMGAAEGETAVVTAVSLDGVLTAPSYDASTRTITFPVKGSTAVEVALGKDLVLDRTGLNRYNEVTECIELYLNDGVDADPVAGTPAVPATKIEVPVGALIDRYTVVETNTVSGSVTTNSTTYTVVTPTGEEDPSEEGWFERSGEEDAYTYTLTEDTSVDNEATYYVHEPVVKEIAMNVKISNKAGNMLQALPAVEADAQNGIAGNTAGLYVSFDPSDIDLSGYITEDDLATTNEVDLAVAAMIADVFGSNEPDLEPEEPAEPTYTEVEPEGTENPSEEGWYERSGEEGSYVYTLSEDVTVDSNKTYYALDTE